MGNKMSLHNIKSVTLRFLADDDLKTAEQNLSDAEDNLDDAVDDIKTRMIIVWVIAVLVIIWGSVMMHLWCKAKEQIARGAGMGNMMPMQNEQKGAPKIPPRRSEKTLRHSPRSNLDIPVSSRQ